MLDLATPRGSLFTVARPITAMLLIISYIDFLQHVILNSDTDRGCIGEQNARATCVPPTLPLHGGQTICRK